MSSGNIRNGLRLNPFPRPFENAFGDFVEKYKVNCFE
jgi:hypothetical protein